MDEVVANRARLLQNEIDAEDEDYILNVSETDYVSHLGEKYAFNAPVLDVDGIYVDDRRQLEIDVRDDPRYIGGRLKALSITFAVPYTGDADFFSYQPNPHLMYDFEAQIGKRHVRFEWRGGVGESTERIESGYKRTLQAIATELERLKSQADNWNAGLEDRVLQLLAQRRERILSDRDVVESLGIPIRKRDGEAMTYAVPDVKRKITIRAKPTTTREPFEPEPTLAEAEYEEILKIVRNMAYVMERSPKAFERMQEPTIRDHFLVQLNGLYEGAATGETFNYEGKTDILIRSRGRNVFIAECKIWKGAKTVAEAIDQILDYLSWRDTKTAIFMFVRNKDFSAICDKVPSLVEAHPNYKKTLASTGETEFRFLFSHRDDSNRELRLAVLLFPVPRLS
jgi:hypothetical protein